MNLVIDIGNSFWKCAIFESDEIIFKRTFEQSVAKEELHRILNEFKEIEYSILSSVTAVNQDCIQLLQDKTQYISFHHSTPIPITLHYNTPQTLGLDRLAAVVGAYLHFPEQDILIIDAGTCITYEFLNSKGEYHGGAIAPGVQMRFKALHNFTAKLPLIQPNENPPLTGKSTQESILSGVIEGFRDEIKGRIRSYTHLSSTLKVIATGGDTVYFDKALKNTIFADPNLILNGLNFIIQYNYRNE